MILQYRKKVSGDKKAINVSDESSGKEDNLDDNWRDRLVATGKAVVGIVPWAGGALGEILAAVIPGQRADRIALYLRQLSVRIGQLEDVVQRGIATNPAKIELIEEGGYQAGRALSVERISQIVEAVTSGIDSDDAEVVRRKSLLGILGELDDDEVTLLNAYGRNYGNRDDEAWEKVNMPDPTHMQSSRREIDREQLFQVGKDHLIRLGLLTRKYTSGRDGSPLFDKNSGEFKYRTEVSGLGRLLLREIGMTVPFDLEDGA